MHGYRINDFVLANHAELSVISVMRGLKWKCGFYCNTIGFKKPLDQLYTFKLTLKNSKNKLEVCNYCRAY